MDASGEVRFEVAGAASLVVTGDSDPDAGVSAVGERRQSVPDGAPVGGGQCVVETAADLERVARGGLVGRRFSWGDDPCPGPRCAANWWQGRFPLEDEGRDGFRGRAPVGQFPPNGFGLVDMAGNVWEWTADWYDAGYYRTSPSVDPLGPAAGTERSMRGGSFLCATTACFRFRVSARSHATPETGLNHVGFRCAGDRPPAG